MLQEDKMKATGKLTIEIKDKNGNLKDQREKELANFREKKHHQSITLKDFSEKIKNQKEIINLQKQKIVELRGQLKGGL